MTRPPRLPLLTAALALAAPLGGSLLVQKTGRPR